MTCQDRYNFEHFKISHFDFEDFKGPKEGEKAVNFEAFTLDGQFVQFFDYFDKVVVFSTGSYSCPYFAGKIKEMNRLQKKYPQVNFLVLYTRETHPGGRVPVHQSNQDKLRMAKKTSDLLKDQRTLLVDDLSGSAHEKYGGLPNSVYLIDTDTPKTVLYRDEWENAERIDLLLERYFKEEYLNTDQIHALPRKSRSKLYHFAKLLRLAGIIPLFDLIKAAIFEAKGDLDKVKLK